METQEELTLKKTKKILVRRRRADLSQQVRHTVQWLFVALNGWIGVQFYLWVRFYERGGVGLYVPRPAGVEGWLPIAGLMNSRYLVATGRVPAVHPAAMYLFLGFLLMSLLLKKAFCSWLCSSLVTSARHLLADPSPRLSVESRRARSFARARPRRALLSRACSPARVSAALATPLAWRRADAAMEGSSEGCLVAEARMTRNVRERAVRESQQLLGALDLSAPSATHDMGCRSLL